jgi:hypothetical protein
MKLTTLLRLVFLTVFAAAGLTAAVAQTTTDAPSGQPGQPGMMAPGMMGPGMMGPGMMHPGMMGMRAHMMKVMFAIADMDGDGALTFAEVSAVHQRVFNWVDADKDGKVTPEELQAFMRE